MMFLDTILKFYIDFLTFLRDNVWEGYHIPAHFLTVLRNILNGNAYKGIIV